MLPRDRFGDLVVETLGKGPGNYQLPEITSEFITASIPLKQAQQFFLNAAGLGPEAALKIELLATNEKPLPGYSAIIRQSGFQTPIAWKNDAGDLPEVIFIERQRRLELARECVEPPDADVVARGFVFRARVAQADK